MTMKKSILYNMLIYPYRQINYLSNRIATNYNRIPSKKIQKTLEFNTTNSFSIIYNDKELLSDLNIYKYIKPNLGSEYYIQILEQYGDYYIITSKKDWIFLLPVYYDKFIIKLPKNIELSYNNSEELMRFVDTAIYATYNNYIEKCMCVCEVTTSNNDTIMYNNYIFVELKPNYNNIIHNKPEIYYWFIHEKAQYEDRGILVPAYSYEKWRPNSGLIIENSISKFDNILYSSNGGAIYNIMYIEIKGKVYNNYKYTMIFDCKAPEGKYSHIYIRIYDQSNNVYELYVYNSNRSYYSISFDTDLPNITRIDYEFITVGGE